MDTNSYVAFLVFGALLVVVDGQIIYRSGRKYLERSHGDAGAGASMTRLVTVMFHLVVLGLLALISTVDVGADNQTEAVVIKLGIVLLLLAVVHGVTIAILARVRDRQNQEGLLAEEISARHHAEHGTEQGTGVAVKPRAERAGHPVTSPSIDTRGPYSA